MNDRHRTQQQAASARQESWAKLPYVHLAFINAVQLSSYALQPLAPFDLLSHSSSAVEGSKDIQGSKAEALSAWQISLQKIAELPHRQLPSLSVAESVAESAREEAQNTIRKEYSRMPCICLLDPTWVRLEDHLAQALEPESLKKQGLLPIALEEYSEDSLLKAIREGIEHFYPQAFRPDPTVKALEKYLNWQEKRGETEPPKTSTPDIDSSETVFGEDVGLPMAMRYSEAQLDKKQLLQAENLSSRQIHCYWIEGDAPLLSMELSQQLYHQHHRYAAELSYSDIYPQGLVPLLFQAAVLGRLWHLRQCHHQAFEATAKTTTKTQVKHKLPGILKIAERDLNLFAAEPLLTDKDYRMLRLDLRASSKRQFLTLQNLCHSLQGLASTKKPIPTAQAKDTSCDLKSESVQQTTLAKILYWVEHSAESLRSLPRYFPIQISALCPQSCSYCPYPQIMGSESFAPLAEKTSSSAFMNRDLWRSLLVAISDFSGDALINLSPLGEPLLHPEFIDLVADLWQYPELQLVIETSGAQWRKQDILTLLAMNHKEPRITWIISLDALEPKLYQKLRASTETISPLTNMTASQQKAHELVDLLLYSQQSLPQQVYLQAVRMNENDTDLEAFYRYWAEGEKNSTGQSAAQHVEKQARVKAQVIVQKYNSYAHFLPERQPLRLDPVERFPCRRLAREMVFGLNGQAYLCVQDLQQELARQVHPDQNLGCFPQQSLEELWQFGHKLYRQHIDQTYPSICQNCDEYYVYNF